MDYKRIIYSCLLGGSLYFVLDLILFFGYVSYSGSGLFLAYKFIRDFGLFFLLFCIFASYSYFEKSKYSRGKEIVYLSLFLFIFGIIFDLILYFFSTYFAKGVPVLGAGYIFDLFMIFRLTDVSKLYLLEVIPSLLIRIVLAIAVPWAFVFYKKLL